VAVHALGKILVVAGVAFLAAGVLLMFADRIPFLGKLPGDVHIKRENVEFHFPITSTILISALVSLVLWVVSQFRGK
jgi:hypothetical protein